jgi:hypothetical protein
MSVLFHQNAFKQQYYLFAEITLVCFSFREDKINVAGDGDAHIEHGYFFNSNVFVPDTLSHPVINYFPASSRCELKIVLSFATIS